MANSYLCKSRDINVGRKEGRKEGRRGEERRGGVKKKGGMGKMEGYCSTLGMSTALPIPSKMDA
jgi:hypothetical protein